MECFKKNKLITLSTVMQYEPRMIEKKNPKKSISREALPSTTPGGGARWRTMGNTPFTLCSNHPAQAKKTLEPPLTRPQLIDKLGEFTKVSPINDQFECQ